MERGGREFDSPRLDNAKCGSGILPLSERGIRGFEPHLRDLRIVCLSDTHTLHRKIKVPAGDILIHAGDACAYGKESEFRDFAEWFIEQPHRHKIFVAGNHDRFCEKHTRDVPTILGPTVHYLQDALVDIEGLQIYGSPWQPEFCNWAFNLTEERLSIAFALIPENLDILITHGPARVIGDRVKGENIGSFALANHLSGRLLGKEPHYHVFGHCHNGYGVTKGFGGTVAINAAICDEQYRPVNLPIVLNI